MNRAMWFRVLQVAVVAPYLFRVSQKEKGYFGVGLKLVAGSIVAMNIVPLIADAKTMKNQAQTLVAQLVKAQETLAKNQRVPATVDAEMAEFVDIDDDEM